VRDDRRLGRTTVPLPLQLRFPTRRIRGPGRGAGTGGDAQRARGRLSWVDS